MKWINEMNEWDELMRWMEGDEWNEMNESDEWMRWLRWDELIR